MFLELETHYLKKLKIVLKSKLIIYVLIFFAIFRFTDYKVHNYTIFNIDKTSFSCVVTNIKNNNSLELDCGEKLVSYLENNSLKIGDKLKIKGMLFELENNRNFNLFNYKEYQNRNNVFFNLKIYNYEKVGESKNLFLKIKRDVDSKINKLKSYSYLKAFILGDKSEINDDNISIYKKIGIIHLFSISGTHLSFLVGLLSLVYKRNNIKKTFLFAIILFLYYQFIGSISILRCVVQLLLKEINAILGLNFDKKRHLLISILIVIIIVPNSIYNIGFYYSFIISSILTLSSKKLNEIKNMFVKIIYISFLSFIFSIPLNIYSYSELNVLSFLFNSILVPYVSFIVFPFSIITLAFPLFDEFFIIFIKILECLSLWFGSINSSLIFIKPSIAVVVIYYLIIYSFIFYNKKLLVFFLIILCIHYNYNDIFLSNYVLILDVGQGDSILIHNRRTNILIDTGGISNRDILYNNSIPLFKSFGIRNLDYLIITHGDYDHVGEAINLVNNFKVEKVIFNCGEFNDLEKELIKVLDKKKIKYYSCIKELNINENKLYFLQTKVYDNENDNSNVIYTELGGYRFMFMGDASSITEKEILKQYTLHDVDILKVGHHGSRTSSSKEFIDEINPRYSVISVGKNNRYGHPNKEALDNLRESKIYRTDEDGSIMFKIKNNELKIRTCSP